MRLRLFLFLVLHCDTSQNIQGESRLSTRMRPPLSAAPNTKRLGLCLQFVNALLVQPIRQPISFASAMFQVFYGEMSAENQRQFAGTKSDAVMQIHAINGPSVVFSFIDAQHNTVMRLSGSEIEMAKHNDHGLEIRSLVSLTPDAPGISIC